MTPTSRSPFMTFAPPMMMTSASAVPLEPFGGLLDRESMLFEVDDDMEEHVSSADLGTVRQTRRSLKGLLGRVKALKKTAQT